MVSANPFGSIWRRLEAWLRPGAAVASAQEQARRAEHRLREALDVLPEGIVFLDREGRYVLWNKSYAEIYHRSADLFREGVRLADTLRVGVERGDYPEAVGREEAWLAERLALLDNPGHRHEQLLADGRWVLIEERKTADGGVIGIRIDISEHKAQSHKLEEALAQAQAANRAKSDFLANMSHEIRTPLNGVLGLADVLSRTRLDDVQRDLLRTITASANDLNVLLGDMLDFSRLEAGKVQIVETAFSVDEVVEDCAALFRPTAEQKGLTLTVSIAADASGEVMGDPTRLKQILTNLLSNAVKFTKAGWVELNVARTAGQWRFDVSDTGVGFEPADAERLFGRFEQADGSTTRKFGGTGLGLAICRQLAGLMGGTTSAVGRPGEGATFTLVLPLKPVVMEVAEPLVCDSALRVLLVDDNATNRKVVELMLAATEAEVVSVENGALAVEAASQGVFDIILMDIQMPVMDGLTASRAIRDLERAAGRTLTPIIVLSANADPADRAASAAAGACAHLAKPIRADELLSTMMAALGDATLEAVA